MLNRRILRVKALQSLYSYYIARNSLRDVVAQKLEARYELDPAVHDFADRPFFEERKKKLGEVFLTALDGGEIAHPDLAADELNSVADFKRAYENEVASEHVAIRKNMLSEAKFIYRAYLKLLILPLELVFLEKQEKEKLDRNVSVKNDEWHFNLLKNPVIDSLSSFEALQEEVINKKIDWKSDHDEVRHWYRDIIKKDEKYLEYQATKEPSFEEHQQILLYLFKKVVFKNEEFENYFTGKDLYWEENRISLRSMITKTIKGFEPELDQPFELLELSRNEEDDFDFFKRIFDETIKKDEQLEGIIAGKTKNWDLSRIAAIDKIIMKMALAEMISFPSIPIKVTINEFIEISKNYSTPKSKQFINGILDVLANELTSEGVIKKSGRGLIDNK